MTTIVSTTPFTMPFASLYLSDDAFTNPRTRSGLEDDAIRELAMDIGLRGLLVPLLVTPEGLVIAGQRRYRAIELLILWFTDNEKGHELARKDDEMPFGAALTPDGISMQECSIIERNVKLLVDAVPVRTVTGTDVELHGVAIADNLLRSAMNGYELAARLADLAAGGATGRQLARLTGKSTSWVSRKLTAWKGASPELKHAWELGESDDVVFELAQLPHDQQKKALATNAPRGRRGAANRPPIDQVKDVLSDVERIPPKKTHRFAVSPASVDVGYSEGVIDALRWVCGADASQELAKLIDRSREVG